jgi:hypothetical protein
MASPPTDRDRLAGLVTFLPAFESPGFSFAELIPSKELSPGVFNFPYYSYSDTALAFTKAAYDLGWVGDFDYATWMHTTHAKRLRDDRGVLARARAESLRRLLTVLIRHDRFVDGELAWAYESGLLTAIVRRASVLLDELNAHSPPLPPPVPATSD